MSAPNWSPFRLAEEILSSGVKILQLRQKNLSSSEFLKLAEEIYYLKIHNDFKLIINHFVDVASQLKADGVHLTSQSISVAQAREKMGDQAIIGVSVHSVEEGMQKAKEGADYLTFGAIYPTSSKDSSYPIQGIKKLKELAQSVSIPVVAIGGITEKNIQEVKKAGASAFSALSAVLQHKNPSLVIKEFLMLSSS